MAEGLGLGLVGAVFKPASGVLDAISHTTEGIRNQVLCVAATTKLLLSPHVHLMCARVCLFADESERQGGALETDRAAKNRR